LYLTSIGTVVGLSERFTGIGVIVDTFRNVETITKHRDVQVLINDGYKTYEEMIETVR